VVTDVRMPGMDGTELLSQVRERHPDTIRIVLSGQADRDLTLRSAASAHQYLSKPCDAEALRLTITRASALKDVLSDPSLQNLVAGAKSLPSVPRLFQELLQALDSPEASVEDVAKAIAADTGMTAKILQLANSAFFGVPRRIVDPRDAVLYLGFDTVRALALTIQIFTQFSSSACPAFSISRLSSHGVLTGALARQLAKSAGVARQIAEDAFMAGLLHDVGKLLLVDALPEKYGEAIRLAQTSPRTDWEAEREVFGITHAEVGTCLLWMWGLPDPVVEAVSYHHYPSRCPDQRWSPLTAVHLADILSHAGRENHAGPALAFDLDYLNKLGLPLELEYWQTQAEEPRHEKELV
jgi:HD-like signal output (HDOD) protein